jgi:cell division protein FtsB
MDLLARRLVWTVLPALLVIWVIYLAIWGEDGLWARHRIEVELTRTERRLSDLDAENARLAREVTALQGDATTLQRAATEELLLVPPGSTVYRFDP